MLKIMTPKELITNYLVGDVFVNIPESLLLYEFKFSIK